MALVFGAETEPSSVVTTKTSHPAAVLAQSDRALLSPLRSRRRPSLNMYPPHLVDTLSKLTPETVERIREGNGENVILPNLLVDFEDFRSWHEADQLPIEYSSDTKKITVLAPPGPIHQKLENTMNLWLEEMATNLTNEGEIFSSQTQYSVKLDDGRKVPDTVLLSQDIARKHPIVAVEIGWTEPVEKLFEDAERLIRGTKQGINIVILLKVSEKNRHTRNEFPWGIHPHDITRLKELNDANQLAPTILDWYKNNNFALLGQLYVDLYWYPRTRKTRPTKPIYHFHYSVSDPPEPNGAFTQPFNTARKTLFLTKEWKAKIEGKSFELPTNALEQALRNGAILEQNKRVYDIIEGAGI